MIEKKLTDAEEAEIQKMIASDPDAPEITDEEIATAKPFAEAFPALADEMRKNLGGRPRSESPKVAVSIRLDQDIVAYFKASGSGWQSRVNAELRKALKRA